MGMSENSSWPTLVADKLDLSLCFWHAHRLTLVNCFLVSGLLIILFRSSRRTVSKQPSSPATQEEAAWLTQEVVKNEKEKEKKVEISQVVDTVQTKSATTARKSRPIAPRVVSGRKPVSQRKTVLPEAAHQKIKPLVFYTSLTGTTKSLSDHVLAQLRSSAEQNTSILDPAIHDLSYIDLDDYFISGPKTSQDGSSVYFFYVLLIPSYDIDTIMNNFLEHLNETHNDFRIDTAPLSSLVGYSVFGVGDKQGWPTEEQGFCAQAIEVDRWMAKLTGRKRAYPLGLGDVKDNLTTTVEDWTRGVCQTLVDISANGGLGEGVPGSGNAVESDEEDVEDVDFPDLGRKKRQKTDNTIDLEDVGGKKKLTSAPVAVDFTTYSATSNVAPLKAMVPKESPTYTSLTKQGYTIVGSHSGVKICRWTKSALRGRGSCYKNSFYGIASHLCMETTPSLSCSNKCVFCWRHGTNPVSTTWRWQVDDPQMIFDGAKEGHYKKIKMMRGVPGVRSERFEEAMRIRHCALSLVGEPIFYPRINEFLGLLHGEHISSFLVCNAQHPQQLRDLQRVTQLYVSIDASNKESLRKIDRPLHRDFWERFQDCLDILREKRFVQRTVFRLTLVKGFNVEDEVEGYADLVEKGLPCFVEVKGVTYCGTTSAAGAGLTMQNVPFYEEVVQFVEALDGALKKRGLQYGIAAEHAHSCCILLASNRFYIDEKWHTVIDYEKFFKLLDAGDKDFGAEDYCKPTAAWALWGNGGFDPRDQRVDRKGRPKEVHS